MIVKLQPDQISSFWDLIKHAVLETSHVPKSRELHTTNNVLAGLYSGKYQCWLLYSIRDGERIFHAVTLTAIQTDSFFDLQYLWMGCMYGYRVLTDELILELKRAIEDFAKTHECQHIQITTRNKRIEEFLKLMEWDNHLYTVYSKFL